MLRQHRNAPLLARLLVLITGIAVIVFILASPNDEQPDQATTKAVLQMEEQRDLQTAVIEVSALGYRPQTIELQEGVLAKVNFRLSQCDGCDKQLISKELDIHSTLREGDNIFLLRNSRPGSYPFTSGSGNLTGTITVRSAKTVSP